MTSRTFPWRHASRLAVLATASFWVSPPAAAADPTPPPAAPTTVPEADVLIDGDAAQGRVALNAAAGNHNQQANVAAIAIGGVGLAGGSISQHLVSSGPQTGSAASAMIAENAFAGSSGLIAVNIAAGSENQQANLALIAIGIEGIAITDAALSQTRAAPTPVAAEGDTAQPERIAAIGPDAFAGSAGLVQVNLIGGERNSSANIFALSVAAGVN